jgi:hypothetical protein
MIHGQTGDRLVSDRDVTRDASGDLGRQGFVTTGRGDFIENIHSSLKVRSLNVQLQTVCFVLERTSCFLIDQATGSRTADLENFKCWFSCVTTLNVFIAALKIKGLPSLRYFFDLLTSDSRASDEAELFYAQVCRCNRICNLRDSLNFKVASATVTGPKGHRSAKAAWTIVRVSASENQSRTPPMWSCLINSAAFMSMPG